MRIFFLMSCFYALLSISVLVIQTPDFIDLHQFIFYHLFVASAFVGFLLTAIPIWCEYEKSLIPFSVPCFVLLVFALVFLSFNGIRMYFIVGFWIVLTVNVLWLLLIAKNSNHLDLVFLLFCIDLTLIYGVYNGIDYNRALLHLYMAGIVMVTTRVGSVLGQECLDKAYHNNTLLFLPHRVFANLTATLLVFLAFSSLGNLSPIVEGFLSLGVGFTLTAQLPQWHFKVFFRFSFIRIFYGLLLFMALFYLGWGVNDLLQWHYTTILLHGLNIFVLMGFILLIQSIVSLRHSGLELLFPLGVNVGFFMLFIAMLLRLMGSFYPLLLSISALLLFFIFVLFFSLFLNIYRKNDFVA